MAPECGICLSEYNERDHAPRMLNCGHTVCEKCARAFLRQEGGVQIKCPFDRKVTRVSSGDVKKLPKNFALLELSNGIKTTVEVSATSHSGPKCALEQSHQATVFCKTCQVDFCEKCFRKIHSPQVLADHKKVPIACKPSRSPECQSHPGKVVEYVCKESTCRIDPKLMCQTCLPRHRNHRKENFQDAVKRNQKLLEVQLENLQLQSNSLERDIGELKENSAAYRAKVAEISEYFHRQKCAALETLSSTAACTEAMCSADVDALQAKGRFLNLTMEKIERRLATKTNLECIDDVEMGEIYESEKPPDVLENVALSWPTAENVMFELIPQP